MKIDKVNSQNNAQKDLLKLGNPLHQPQSQQDNKQAILATALEAIKRIDQSKIQTII